MSFRTISAAAGQPILAPEEQLSFSLMDVDMRIDGDACGLGNLYVTTNRMLFIPDAFSPDAIHTKGYLFPYTTFITFGTVHEGLYFQYSLEKDKFSECLMKMKTEQSKVLFDVLTGIMEGIPPEDDSEEDDVIFG
ncbi:hypothetical protein P9112_003072 [Eukaryota sp. TZLM1-RC]